MGDPNVYFDVNIGGYPDGRIVMELFADDVPKTATNLLEFGKEQIHGKRYKECPINRVFPSFTAQGGKYYTTLRSGTANY